MSNSKKDSATTSICGFDEDNISIRGQDLVNDMIGKLSFTEAWLIQSLGIKPTEKQIKIVDAVLVTIMEHGLVPSAVASRLTIFGAPESFQGAVAAGLLGVGDRYAGTATQCGLLLERLCASKDLEEEAKLVVQEYREKKLPLPGFGHPIHKKIDPRVTKLLDVCMENNVSGSFIEAMYSLESALSIELNKTIVTNISAAIGAALAEAGIPSQMMRGVVLTARCAGLVGHVLEEMNSPAAQALWDGAQDAIHYDQ
jgi:citrate synthase